MTSRFKWTIVASSALVVVLLLVGAVHGRAVPPDDVYGHLKVYSEVLQRIKLDYVEEPDMKTVTLGSINGLLESLDPFASYLSADQYKQYLKTYDTFRGGVGLVLAKRYGYVAVVDALPDSPAARAHIANGDLLESINGVATRDMPLAFAEQLLKGEPGSTVQVTLLRLRNPEPQKIVMTRAVVPLPAIATRMLPDDVGLVQVTSLAGKRVEEAKEKIQGLTKSGARYLVLDLRHCSTGEQENGAPLANLFIDNGEITSLKGQRFDRKEVDARAEDDIYKGPLVVLTNRSTAGPAEIAAAALLDSKRAQVLGERTYGDASIRRTIQMNDGGAVILAVAKFYSPAGKAIQDTGVVPSVQVAEADNSPELDQNGNPIPGSEPKNQEDTLLKQAVELVTGRKTVAQLNSVSPAGQRQSGENAPLPPEQETDPN